MFRSENLKERKTHAHCNVDVFQVVVVITPVLLEGESQKALPIGLCFFFLHLLFSTCFYSEQTRVYVLFMNHYRRKKSML